MHRYKVYFNLQPNMTSDAEFESNLDIVEYYEDIKRHGFILAVFKGMSLLIPFHAINGIVEGTL